jgi:alpha-N-acetylglucosamine transferase
MEEGLRSARPAISGRAFVTLVTNDDYAWGARALIRSLRLSGTKADLVAMHTPAVSPALLNPLSAMGTRLIEVDLLPTSDEFNAAHSRQVQHAAAPFTRGAKPSFHTPLDNFVKLRLWQMTEYRQVVFIDADALVLQNCDRLFDYPEFCGAPNVFESLADFHRLNTGVFTARPDKDTFDRMIGMLDTEGAFWRRTDQTFLEYYFPDWHGLPIYDNMLQYVWINLPELWDWEAIRILHYQFEKPWTTPHPKANELAPLIDLWRAYAGFGPVPDPSTLPGPGGD